MSQEYFTSLDNLMDPTVLTDPYPLYARLRRDEPVHWNPLLNSWVVTRYAEVAQIVQDASRFSSEPARRSYGVPLTPEDQAAVEHFYALLSLFMQASDPPRHTRLRRLVNRAFTPRAIERLRTNIQQFVDNKLNEVEEAGQLELIEQLAYPLPSFVIAELLGIPQEGQRLFKASSGAIASFLGILNPAPGQMVALEAPLLEVAEFLKELVRQRRHYPQEDLLSAIGTKDEQGEGLSEAEIVVTAMFLLFAGHETTTNLIGNGMLALLRHPAELQKLRSNPALITPAVEELLRYDSPVQGVGRVARVDIELGGQAIKAGQRVWIMFGAANHDQAVFEEPEKLKLERAGNQSLGFGHGLHYCVGAALARLEAQIALNSLVQRFTGLELATDRVEWRPNFALRGLKALPLTF
jgi:cytochrome P450